MESPDAHHSCGNVPLADVTAQGQKHSKPALLSPSSHFLHTISFSLVLSLRPLQSNPLCINHLTFFHPIHLSLVLSLSLTHTLACQCFIRRDILLSVPVTSSIASPSNQLCLNEFYWQSLNAHKQLCATGRGCKADLRVVKGNGYAHAEELIHHSLHRIPSSYCPRGKRCCFSDLS